MQILSRAACGSDLGFTCLSGRFHCPPWALTAVSTHAWSWCRYGPNCTAASLAPPARRSVCFSFFTFITHSWWWSWSGPEVLEDDKWPDFLHLLWKDENKATHKLIWPAAILTNTSFPSLLGLLLMQREWNNPGRTKQSKMVLIYLPVWSPSRAWEQPPSLIIVFL